MNYQGVKKAWMYSESNTTEEIINLSMVCHILTLKEDMNVQIKGENATAELQSINGLTEREQWIHTDLSAWLANALRKAPFCLLINKMVYIPTQYMAQRNLRDVLRLSRIHMSRNTVFFYMPEKNQNLKSEAVFYLDLQTRGHRFTDSIVKFFSQVEDALLKFGNKKISMDISKKEVLNCGYFSLRSRKKEQFRTILNNTLDKPLLSAYQSIETLFSKKDHANAFPDEGKAKFLLVLGGVLMGANSVC